MPIFEENGPDNFKGVDIMRAVRSFDPCLPCGVHMYLGGGRTLQEDALADVRRRPWLSAGPRLDDAAVRAAAGPPGRRCSSELEQTPGPAGELALEAVSSAGRGVRRGAGAGAGARRRAPAGLVADELLRHLLLLHRIHPDPVERRGRTSAGRDGACGARARREVALAGLDDGVARVRLTVSGCGAARRRGRGAHAVLAVAPELSARSGGRRRRRLRRSSRSGR